MMRIKPDPNPQHWKNHPYAASANTVIMATSLSSILVFLLSVRQQRLAYSISDNRLVKAELRRYKRGKKVDLLYFYFLFPSLVLQNVPVLSCMSSSSENLHFLLCSLANLIA